MTGDKGLVATTSGSGAAREATSASPGWTGAVGEPTRLLLLRHGQTPMSIDRRYSGSSSNPSLTDFGRRQARAAAERLALGDWDIRGIIVSPQARALETAEYASAELGLDICVDDDLRETDFGTWEGLTFGEAAARDADVHARWLTDPELPPPGGEAFRTVDDRVAGARRRLAADFGTGTFLVVSHVTPVKALQLDGDAQKDDPFTVPEMGGTVYVVRSTAGAPNVPGQIFYIGTAPDPFIERSYNPPFRGSHGALDQDTAVLRLAIPVPEIREKPVLEGLTVEVYRYTKPTNLDFLTPELFHRWVVFIVLSRNMSE